MTPPELLDRAPSPAAWSWGTWLALVLGTITEAVICTFAALFIAFGASTTCGDPASTADLRDGELAGLFALTVALLPWAVGLIRTAHRARLTVGALLATSPLLVLLVAGLDRDFWVGSFCF